MGILLKKMGRAAGDGVQASNGMAGEPGESSMKHIEGVKETVQHVGRRAPGGRTLLKAINTAMGMSFLLRYIEPARMLGWVGLSRRRVSPFRTMALIGAGAVAGAGITMLCAPRTGGDTRRAIARSFRTITRKGREMLDRAEARMEQLGERIGEKASDLAEGATAGAGASAGQGAEGRSGGAGSSGIGHAGAGDRPGSGTPDLSASSPPTTAGHG